MSTVTIDLESHYSYNSTMSGDYITISSDSITDFNAQYEIDFGDEWRTHFPDFREVQKMREEYPALEKAFENFKTIYEMVKDDYASKTREEDQ